MTDQTTASIPQTTPQAAPIPNQSADFFGGGEEAFQNGKVIDPTWAPWAQAPAFTPSEPAWEPTLPEEATAVEDGELKIENKPENTEEPVDPIINIVEPAAAPIEEEEEVEEKEEEKPSDDEEDLPFEPIPTIDNEPIPAGDQSDLSKKFLELFELTRKIYELTWLEESFDVLWADNDKLRIVYKFFAGDKEYPLVSVTKIETEKADNEETIHELSFYLNESGKALNINLDEELLFDEDVDLVDDMKKKMQVADKINKFIFLLSEEAKKLEKAHKEKEAEQEEKRKLQDVFRNF